MLEIPALQSLIQFGVPFLLPNRQNSPFKTLIRSILSDAVANVKGGYTSPRGLSFPSTLGSFCRICSVNLHCKIWCQCFSATEEQCRKEEARD